jgi:hypothetical protein
MNLRDQIEEAEQRIIRREAAGGPGWEELNRGDRKLIDNLWDEILDGGDWNSEQEMAQPLFE